MSLKRQSFERLTMDWIEDSKEWMDWLDWMNEVYGLHFDTFIISMYMYTLGIFCLVTHLEILVFAIHYIVFIL